MAKKEGPGLRRKGGSEKHVVALIPQACIAIKDGLQEATGSSDKVGAWRNGVARQLVVGSVGGLHDATRWRTLEPRLEGSVQVEAVAFLELLRSKASIVIAQCQEPDSEDGVCHGWSVDVGEVHLKVVTIPTTTLSVHTLARNVL